MTPGGARQGIGADVADRRQWCAENLPGFRCRPDGESGEARCELPGHEDRRPSLFVGFRAARGTYSCQACGRKGSLADYATETSKPPFPQQQSAPQRLESLRWVYQDRLGAPLLRVTRGQREGRKTYWQERWEGGAWVKGGLHPSPLLYAPELAAAPAGSPCFVVEGEKCAQHLTERGLLATTAPEGAGRVARVGRDYLELLLPLGVVILPDNDEPGMAHALQVAERLRSELAIEARVLLLPGLGPKQDVADWLVLPRTKADLLALLPTAITLDELRTRICKPAANRNRITLTGITGEKAELILAGMRRANQPLRACIWAPTEKVSDLREGALHQCTTPEGLAHLCEVGLGLRFFKLDNQGEEMPCDAPDKALKRILGMPAADTGLPVVTELLDAPVLAEDGTLVLRPGLHPTGLYLRPGLDLPRVPPSPTPEQTAQALRELDRLICDFPLEGVADRQAWMSYLLTGFAAGRAPRPWPLWNFSAPLQGSGKGLLASLPSWIATGKAPGVVSLDTSEKDSEVRKKLTSLLDSSPARWQVLDNLRGHLASGALEAFLTSQTWTDRLLGGNRMGNWPIRVALAITGNNLTLSPDLERRQILVRLLPNTDKPWMRNDFAIKDLLGYIQANRPKLVWCVMVLVQRWASLGFPQSERRLGSFEGWSSAIGGLLECIGIGSDFLASARVLHREDPWLNFVQAWADSHLERLRQPASELVRFVERSGIVLSSESPASSLGRKLARLDGRVFAVETSAGKAVLRLCSGHSGRSTHWSLVEIGGQR